MNYAQMTMSQPNHCRLTEKNIRIAIHKMMVYESRFFTLRVLVGAFLYNYTSFNLTIIV